MGVINPLPDIWLLRKTDHLENELGLTDQPDFWYGGS